MFFTKVLEQILINKSIKKKQKIKTKLKMEKKKIQVRNFENRLLLKVANVGHSLFEWLSYSSLSYLQKLVVRALFSLVTFNLR